VRAIFFFVFFIFALIVGVRAPFVAALVYLWVDLITPQSVGYGFIESIPLAMISGVCSIAFYFLFDKKERVHLGFQWMCLVSLAIWVTVTTLFIAKLPEYAWPKWNWAFKTLMFVSFMPFVFRTRVRLEALLLTFVTCVGVVALSLAVKTLAGGAGYASTRIWGGVNATALGESSGFSLVAAAMIPFIYVLARNTVFFTANNKKIIFLAFGLISVFVIAILGSYARTGLVCLAVLALLQVIVSKHRVKFIFFMLIAGLMAFPLLPKEWTTRMNTIQSGDQEGSTGTRVAVWKWTLGYVAENPLGGGFDIYRLNEIELTVADPSAPEDPTRKIKIKQRARAFHNNYFEVLGEQGWPGLMLFFIINWLAVTKSWQVWRAKLEPQFAWLNAYAGANLMSLLIILTGSMFAGNAFKIFTYLPIVNSMILINLLRKANQETISNVPNSSIADRMHGLGNTALSSAGQQS
jgi:putative inorganic carbon (hco3(-)) transporter